MKDVIMLVVALAALLCSANVNTEEASKLDKNVKMHFSSADSFYAVCDRAENRCQPVDIKNVVICFCAIDEEWSGDYECNDCQSYDLSK